MPRTQTLEWSPIAIERLDLKQFDLTDKDSNNLLYLPEEFQNIAVERIKEIKNSHAKIAEVAKRCIEFVAYAEEDIDYGSKQGFFSRAWGAITGKNHQRNIQTHSDLLSAQKTCVQMINEMGKQMLISQEMVLMLQHAVNYLINEERGYRKELIERLNKIFEVIKFRFERLEKNLRLSINELSRTRDMLLDMNETIEIIKMQVDEHEWKILDLENKTLYLYDYIEKVRKQVDTLNWLEYSKCYGNRFENIEDRMEKFLELTVDFYEAKLGEFTYQDLLIFSNALNYYGFGPKEEVTINVFLDYYFKLINNKMQKLGKEYLNKIDEYFQLEMNIKLISAYPLKLENESALIYLINNANFLFNTKEHVPIEIFKDEIIKVLDEKFKLNVDKPLNWFLIAAEILTYLRVINDKEPKELKEIVNPFKEIKKKISEIVVNDIPKIDKRINEMDVKINDKMEKVVNDIPKIQSGWVFDDCNNPNFPLCKGEGERYNYWDVTFENPFKDVPKIYYSISSWDMSQNFKVWTEINEVTTKGFRVRASTWNNTRIWSLRIGWLAYGV